MGKDRNFISEYRKFFTDSKADKAMHAIMDMAARIRFDDSLELSVTERLWQALLDLVAEIAEIFGIDDDNVFDILVNKSDQLNHFVNFYKLKQAC